jgi:hypothetical protein
MSAKIPNPVVDRALAAMAAKRGVSIQISGAPHEWLCVRAGLEAVMAPDDVNMIDVENARRIDREVLPELTARAVAAEKALAEKTAEFNRMENEWRRRCAEIRRGTRSI